MALASLPTLLSGSVTNIGSLGTIQDSKSRSLILRLTYSLTFEVNSMELLMASPRTFWAEPEWVSNDVIQQLFNELQLFEQANRGKLKRRVWGQDSHLTRHQRRKAKEPRCTRSQIVLYSTLDDKLLALVHQYRRPNGQLGGSGRPDPKILFISGRILALRESP